MDEKLQFIGSERWLVQSDAILKLADEVLVEFDGRIGYLAQRKDLPHYHSKGPHVTLSGVHSISQGFDRHPFDGHRDLLKLRKMQLHEHVHYIIY